MTTVMPVPSTTTTTAGHAPGFLRRFLPVWGLGLLGVAALLLQAPPAELLIREPALRDASPLTLRLLLLVNPLLLVTAMAALGAALAPRAGLRSRLAGDRGARLGAATALAAGLGVAAVLLAIDRALTARLGDAWLPAGLRAAATPGWTAGLVGVLYGGLAEEVMLRWGLMSLVVWGVQRALPRAAGSRPGAAASAAAWAGILVAAAAFAAGHLPALAQAVDPGALVITRTLLLNALAGIVYGWLFWRRSLECAMLAHAATHGGWALARLLG